MSATPEPVIRLVGIKKSFGRRVVLDDISFDVAEGSVVCVIGPSGSGKSTMLRCISRLDEPDGGFVVVDSEPIGYRLEDGVARQLNEREISRQRTKIGMIFQSFNLFPHMTALQNVMFGPVNVLGAPRADAERRGRDLLGRVGLGDRADAYPRHLSGGQQQRVAIARALAMEPRVLLCDEPTSALDPQIVGEVLQVLKALAQEGVTMIIVTHEIQFAREVADRVIFFDEGRIRADGTAEQILVRSTDDRIRTFLRNVEVGVDTSSDISSLDAVVPRMHSGTSGAAPITPL